MADLDFSWMDQIKAQEKPKEQIYGNLPDPAAVSTFSHAEEEDSIEEPPGFKVDTILRRSESAQKPQNNSNQENAKAKQENAQNGPENGHRRPIALNRLEEDQRKARETYAAHQEATVRTEKLMVDILKGMQKGDSLASLFLKACEGLSLATGNSVFLEEVEKNLAAIYAAGLSDPEAFQIQQEKARERLRTLEAARDREKDPAVRQRLKNAIEAHMREFEIESENQAILDFQDEIVNF